MKRRKLLVCAGKRCRKALAKNERLAAMLEQHGIERIRVGCQKVCNGPVVGVAVDGQLEWFERVSSPKALRSLVELIDGGEIGKPLRRRHIGKRAGKLRS